MAMAADLMTAKRCTEKVKETSDQFWHRFAMSSVMKSLKKFKQVLYLTVKVSMDQCLDA